MRDVFHACLVKGAELTGSFDLPCIESCNEIPKNIIQFSHCNGIDDYRQFVHFYENDDKYERLWNYPRRYIKIIKRFDGVITPDFSLYRSMSLAQQIWNTYRNRVLGFWINNQGIPTIPNVRYGDERTYDFCFDGIPKNSIIAIGMHGCAKHPMDIKYHQSGIEETINRLHPCMILLYGAVPGEIRLLLEQKKQSFIKLKSGIAKIYSRENDKQYPLFDIKNGGAA
jgi:hypothetical protein